MSVIYFGQSLESAEALAKEHGYETVEQEPELTRRLVDEYAERLNRPREDDALRCRLMDVRMLSYAFREKFGEGCDDQPVIVALARDVLKDRLGDLTGPLPLPAIAPYLYKEVWEEREDGWKKVRPL